LKKEKINFIVKAKLPDHPVGWLETKLPKTAMMRLQSYIETAKKNPVNHNKHLVGNISKSLLLEDKDDWFFKMILAPLVNHFSQTFPTYVKEMTILTDDAPLCLDTFWVNFQKQHEFNPFHNHTGVFSFVVWVKIPTDWREQHALPISANSNSPCASNFEFQFTSMFGQIAKYAYLLGKTSEGGMLFFPAGLNHAVYPFYNCDKERISISGNIKVEVK